MSLKRKLLIVSGIAFFLYLLLLFIAIRSFLLPNFIQLERKEIEMDRQRLDQVILMMIEDTSGLLSWVSGIALNESLLSNQLQNLPVDLIGVYDDRGFRWLKGSEGFGSLIAWLNEQNTRENSKIQGIWISERGPIFIAAQSLPSASGSNNNWLLVGRFWNRRMNEQLAIKSQVNFQAFPLYNEPLSATQTRALQRLEDCLPEACVQKTFFKRVTLKAVHALNFPQKMAIETTLVRSISSTAYTAMWFTFIASVFSGLLSFLFMALLIRVIQSHDVE